MTSKEIWDKALEFKIQQIESEFTAMLEEIPDGATGIDIGCCFGGTTVGFSYKCSKLCSVDVSKIFDTTDIEARCNHFFAIGNSTFPTTIKMVNDFYTGEQVDFLFIDGDHSEEGAYADYMNYKHLVKSGGKIFFHDIVDSPFHRIHGCYVGNAWNRVKSQHTIWKEFNAGEVWAGIGMVVV